VHGIPPHSASLWPICGEDGWHTDRARRGCVRLRHTRRDRRPRWRRRTRLPCADRNIASKKKPPVTWEWLPAGPAPSAGVIATFWRGWNAR